MRLRAALWHVPAPRGHVVLLPGRTEFLEKVAMLAAGFQARGLAVAALDWRGQGLSDRLIPDRPLIGHVGDFAEYERDLAALLATRHVAALPGPRLWCAHSMGAAVALGALGRGAAVPAGLILSAPMIRIAMAWPLRAASWLTVRIARLLGRTGRWPPFGDMATPYALREVAENVLTGDEAVWAWLGAIQRRHPELAIAMPSIGWFDAAARRTREIARAAPPCPVVMVIGRHDAVVDPAAALGLAAREGWRATVIEDARHEPFIERPALRAQAWAAVDGFLPEVLGASGAARAASAPHAPPTARPPT